VRFALLTIDAEGDFELHDLGHHEDEFDAFAHISTEVRATHHPLGIAAIEDGFE
jgi:hypothetical protein